MNRLAQKKKVCALIPARLNSVRFPGKALKQIEEKDYVAKLKQDGMKNFIKYGIACFKKICKVKVE